MGRDNGKTKSYSSMAGNRTFHVDNLSSAHVYLRMPNDGCTWDNLPPAVINQCCQIVKIIPSRDVKGLKLQSYTPFLNLHKYPQTMQAGAVAYHDRKKVGGHGKKS